MNNTLSVKTYREATKQISRHWTVHYFRPGPTLRFRKAKDVSDPASLPARQSWPKGNGTGEGNAVDRQHTRQLKYLEDEPCTRSPAKAITKTLLNSVIKMGWFQVLPFQVWCVERDHSTVFVFVGFLSFPDDSNEQTN